MIKGTFAPSLAPETSRLNQTLQNGGLSKTSGTEQAARSFETTLTEAGNTSMKFNFSLMT